MTDLKAEAREIIMEMADLINGYVDTGDPDNPWCCNDCENGEICTNDCLGWKVDRLIDKLTAKWTSNHPAGGSTSWKPMAM